MQQRKRRLLAVGVMAGTTILACLIRSRQLGLIFDASGLPEAGHPLSWMLGVLSLLFVIECALFACSVSRTQREAAFCRDTASFVLSAAAALVLAAGGAVGLWKQLRSHENLEAALSLVQLLAAICVLAAAWRRRNGSREMLALHAVICIWQVAVLLLRFRVWSTDPTILDYCFRLFALICGMCACYHIGALCFQKNGGRIAAFWCLTGCFMSMVSMIGEALIWKLMQLGVFLWLFANVWQLYGAGETEEAAAESFESPSGEQ